MLTPGPGKKVGVYVSEDQQYHGSAAYAAILDFLFFHGVSGATVTRGIARFGADHHLHTTRLVDLAVRLPVKVEFIESCSSRSRSCCQNFTRWSVAVSSRCTIRRS